LQRGVRPGGNLRADAAGIPAGRRGPAGMPAVPGGPFKLQPLILHRQPYAGGTPVLPGEPASRGTEP